MPRIKGIDGLRGWLACLVMICHIDVYCGLDQQYAFLNPLASVGSVAVSVFIIISGFVISHLLLEKSESYLVFICRRFFRIYPLFFVCLISGIFTTRLYYHAFLTEPWGSASPLSRLASILVKNQNELHFVPNLIAHLSMLHGVISNGEIYGASTAFLPPGWSLSLEWQFYLIAPIVLWTVHHSSLSRVGVALVAALAYWAYQIGLFGTFSQPSFLPGAVPLFAVGISTRVAMSKLPTLSVFPVASVVIGGAVLISVGDALQLLPFYVWMVFVSWCLLDQPLDPLSVKAKAIIDDLLLSKAARFAGKLSYAVYLVHMPVIYALLYVSIVKFHFDQFASSLTLVIAAPVVTFLLSVALHRVVELPFIKFAKALFSTKSPTETAYSS